MEHGKRLNPERSLRTPEGIKGTRQKVIVTHNPSEIDSSVGERDLPSFTMVTIVLSEDSLF